MLDNTPSQPSKFRTKNWVEMNDYSRRTYNTNSQIKFKTSKLNSSSCNFSDPYILVKGTISIEAQAGHNPNNSNKEVVFKNYAPFTYCISEIYNTQIDKAEDIDVVMPMHNSIEYSNYYSKISESLWQHYRDEIVLTDVGAIANFSAANNSASFKFK